MHEQFFRSEHLFTAKSVLNAAKFALKRTLLSGKIVFRSFGSEILFLKSDWARQREKNLVRCFREGKISALSRKNGQKKVQKNDQKKRRETGRPPGKKTADDFHMDVPGNK